MARYGIYIDGFNVYHALKEDYPQYMWLDYRKLIDQALCAKDTIERIVYFSAYAKWKQGAVLRHREYIKALRSAGIDVILGKFKRTTRKCKLCQKKYSSHEEKRTDVNIALQIVADAVDNVYDRALILTADSDLIPAVEMVHQLTPGKEVGIMRPIGRVCGDLSQHVDFSRKMSQKLLRQSQFPDEIVAGADRIIRPASWATENEIQ